MTKKTLQSEKACLIFSMPLALLSVIMAGCQALPSPVLSTSVPVYATIADAQAVAAGQFSAVPVEIASEPNLEVLWTACGSSAAQVRLRSGKIGWVPSDSLQPVLRVCQKNQPENSAWKRL